MSRFVWKIVVMVGATVLTLCLVEVGFRIAYDPSQQLSTERLWRAQREAPSAGEKASKTKIGSKTYREEPLSPAVQGAETTRVLFLGDSFTFGAGVPVQARFTDIIEGRLNGSPAQGRAYHTFNAGISGSYPNHWLENIEPLLDAYPADAVFCVFFLRDGTLLPTSFSHNALIINQIQSEAAAKPLYESSYLLRYFYDRAAWADLSRWFVETLRKAYLGSDQDRRKWNRESACLVEIADACAQRDIPFHLVVFPILLGLDDYGFHDVEQVIVDFAEQAELPVFSLTPGFLGRDEQELWVASDDQHPNEQGHRIAADTLWPYLSSIVH